MLAQFQTPTGAQIGLACAILFAGASLLAILWKLDQMFSSRFVRRETFDALQRRVDEMHEILTASAEARSGKILGKVDILCAQVEELRKDIERRSHHR